MLAFSHAVKPDVKFMYICFLSVCVCACVGIYINIYIYIVRVSRIVKNTRLDRMAMFATKVLLWSADGCFSCVALWHFTHDLISGYLVHIRKLLCLSIDHFYL